MKSQPVLVNSGADGQACQEVTLDSPVESAANLLGKNLSHTISQAVILLRITSLVGNVQVAMLNHFYAHNHIDSTRLQNIFVDGYVRILRLYKVSWIVDKNVHDRDLQLLLSPATRLSDMYIVPILLQSRPMEISK